MNEGDENFNADNYDLRTLQSTLKLVRIFLFVEVFAAACALMGIPAAGWLVMLAATASMLLAFRLALPVFQPPAGLILAGLNLVSWIALVSIPIMLIAGGVSEWHFRAVVVARSVGLLILLGINLGTRQYLVTRSNS